MRRSARSYTLSGPAALLLVAAQIVWIVWCIYVFVKIAAHVGAWPF